MPRWGMVVDLDLCMGCGACVVACQAENNQPINDEDLFLKNRAFEWIRIGRYWDGEEFPDAKAQFLPMMCQHCGNAPCEPVCPVYATFHTTDGLNAQIYNRCIGTRYCGNNCPWNVRFFNWGAPYWEPSFENMLNPDVTVRSRGIMEKCTMCVHRIRRGVREAEYAGEELQDGDIKTACQQTCPTSAIVFGDLEDPESEVSKLSNSKRNYRVLGELGTDTGVSYLKVVNPDAPAEEEEEEHGSMGAEEAMQPQVIWMSVNG